MTSKVLGFEKRNSVVMGKGVPLYCIREDKLVPVVSLEWLKRYCKKARCASCGGLHIVQGAKHLYANDLLLVAEKEAKKGGKKE